MTAGGCVAGGMVAAVGAVLDGVVVVAVAVVVVEMVDGGDVGDSAPPLSCPNLGVTARSVATPTLAMVAAASAAACRG